MDTDSNKLSIQPAAPVFSVVATEMLRGLGFEHSADFGIPPILRTSATEGRRYSKTGNLRYAAGGKAIGWKFCIIRVNLCPSVVANESI